MREKLIELLCKVQDYGTKNTCEEWSVTVECKDNETVADHLIANGVTIATDNNVGDKLSPTDKDINVPSKWISVKDRLPSKEEYTAKAEDGTEYYVRLLIAYKTDIVEYEIGYYDGYKWMTEMPIRLIKDVVAWMPFPNMPQLPKGE